MKQFCQFGGRNIIPLHENQLIFVLPRVLAWTKAISEINMDMKNIPFGTTVWSQIPVTEYKGETGKASWRTQQFDNIRVRLVEYSPGYLADHWCTKGHILLCLEGELHTELADGRTFVLTPGTSYQVADNAEPHRSFTGTGVKLFIVD